VRHFLSTCVADFVSSNQKTTSTAILISTAGALALAVCGTTVPRASNLQCFATLWQFKPLCMSSVYISILFQSCKALFATPCIIGANTQHSLPRVRHLGNNIYFGNCYCYVQPSKINTAKCKGMNLKCYHRHYLLQGTKLQFNFTRTLSTDCTRTTALHTSSRGSRALCNLVHCCSEFVWTFLLNMGSERHWLDSWWPSLITVMLCGSSLNVLVWSSFTWHCYSVVRHFENSWLLSQDGCRRCWTGLQEIARLSFVQLLTP
jgi:hypothetical protein